MLLLIFILLLIAGWQIPRLYQHKDFKELAAFLVLLIIAGIYAGTVIIDFPLPSPFVLIINIINYVKKSVSIK